MGFRVLKFGGSSVANATAMSRVLDIVEEKMKKGRIVLVGSAIETCTNGLELADRGNNSELPKLLEKHLAIVRRLFTGDEQDAAAALVRSQFEELEAAPKGIKVTWGELLSTRILARKLACDGVKTHWVDSRELIVKDDLPLTYHLIRKAVAETDAEVIVAPGFICRDTAGQVGTLGRGGSDYSAALYAAALEADSLQKWTDVSGFMTTNPKQVPAARTIPGMSYRAAREMAAHGSEVLFEPAIAPAKEAGIDIELKNTFDPEGPFTRISARPDSSPWVGITSRKRAIRPGDAPEATESLREIWLVGTSEADLTEAANTAVEALKSIGIAPRSVRPEGTNLLVEVRDTCEIDALRALHRTFFESTPAKEVYLFIAGFGAVGRELVDMVGRTAATVAERTGKVLRVVGLADSTKWRIDLGRGVSSLEGAVPGDFVNAVIAHAPKGSIFVDCTDSETLYQRYPDLFKAGLHIVSANRRSLAVPFVEYAGLQAAARENGRFFRYDTTVGAALPMLESLTIGANSGDEILSIEAVVSCTLNQILGDYDGQGKSFAERVREAQEKGLTERDPRLDLGGLDALRKLLILAREAGVQLERENVEIDPIVPDTLNELPLEEFYQALKEMEITFVKAHLHALNNGRRRRFVAVLEKDATVPLGYRASISVKDVDQTHPAYHLRGTDNAISITTAFHRSPVVIQGAGEGARQAAASLLNDILR